MADERASNSLPFDGTRQALKVEYVTDPVLVPGLRCPHCRSKVRAIRSMPSDVKSGLAVALAEPITWVVLGVASLVGYLWEAVFGFTLIAVVLGPVLALWAYIRSLSKSTFWCGTCQAELPYAAVARTLARRSLW
jgi:hypothetical protein